MVIDNRVLKKTFGVHREDVTTDWRKLQNEELYGLYCPPDSLGYHNKEDKMGWACGTYGDQEKCIHSFGGET
jgi:hypothetical protein